jgi:hypothetical protein
MLLMSFSLCIASVLIIFKQQRPRKYTWLPQVGVHLSVFLFLAGLMIPIFMINKKVAILVSLTIGLVVVVYVIQTMLAFIDRNVIYRTPSSGV